tara:strand:+ start:517 stop:846 length:330 start_codon:yes stop_codon:yes gene_type:complete
MKQAVYFNDFRDAFMSARPDNFSRNGLRVLFDYLEDLEADTGEDMELDVIAICCDFSENTWQAIAQDYGFDTDPAASDEDNQETVADCLSNEGCYLGESDDGSIVYRNF